MNFFSDEKDVLKAALFYASNGIKVFPCHFYLSDDEKTGSFSPVNQHGYKAASSDPAQIEAWWTTFPDALIGMPCGHETGILALTSANSKYTAETLYFYDHTCKKVFLFKYPTSGPRPTCGKIKEGVFAGECSYIVLPPSSFALKNKNHTHGNWIACKEDLEITEVPEELLEKMVKVGSIEEVALREEAKIEAKVEEEAGQVEEIAAKEEAGQTEEEDEEGEIEVEQTDELPALPMHCLTPKLAKIIDNVAQAFGTDHWMPFAGALRAAGSIIGGNYQLNYLGSNPGFLWLCVVALSGTGKTGATSFFYEPVYKAQAECTKIHAEAYEIYEKELKIYEQEEKEALKEKRDFTKKKPKEPLETVYYIDDATPECLIPFLKANPGGFCWSCDEARTLFGSLGRYTKTGSGDAAKSQMLSMYNGQPVRLSRKSSKTSINVDKAWLSIFGTTQPSILTKIFTEDDKESGFLQRFTFISSKKMPFIEVEKRITTEEVKDDRDEIFGNLNKIVKRMVPESIAETKEETQPNILILNEDAKKTLNNFINEIGKGAYYLASIKPEQAGEISSRAARWQDQIPRLVVMMHCIENAEKNEIPVFIDNKTVENSIEIYRAIMAHTDYAWKLIKGEKIKRAKTYDLLTIVDKYLEKDEEKQQLSFISTEKMKDGKTKFGAILEEIGGKISTIATKQSLTKALETAGFYKKKTNVGLKFIINDGDYKNAMEQIKKGELKNPYKTTRISDTLTNDQKEFYSEFLSVFDK